MDCVDPFEPEEGDEPALDVVVVGVVEAAPGPAAEVVGVVPGFDVTVVVVAAALWPDEGRVEAFGLCRMPATARFCCADTCGSEHAAAVPASAKTASDAIAPLRVRFRVRCGVGLSFPGSRAAQGRARTTQRQQRKNVRGKGPVYAP